MPVHTCVAERAWNGWFICHRTREGGGYPFLRMYLSLVELMFTVFTRVPGGVTVGNSGVCCCVNWLLSISLCSLIVHQQIINSSVSKRLGLAGDGAHTLSPDDDDDDDDNAQR